MRGINLLLTFFRFVLFLNTSDAVSEKLVSLDLEFKDDQTGL